MASIILVGFWISASICIVLSAVILIISTKVSQGFEDLLLYGKIRTEQRKWSVVQLIEVEKRCVTYQLIRMLPSEHISSCGVPQGGERLQ